MSQTVLHVSDVHVAQISRGDQKGWLDLLDCRTYDGAMNVIEYEKLLRRGIDDDEANYRILRIRKEVVFASIDEAEGKT